MSENQIKFNLVVADLVVITELFRDEVPSCITIRLEAAVDMLRDMCKSL